MAKSTPTEQRLAHFDKVLIATLKKNRELSAKLDAVTDVLDTWRSHNHSSGDMCAKECLEVLQTTPK